MTELEEYIAYRQKWKAKSLAFGDCPYREPFALVCDGGKCKVCGWNPEVEEKRKKTRRKEFDL